jgi:ribosomal protein S18 acetylase RimI-like enzyme
VTKELVVREATTDDASAIARVHTRSWQDAYAHVFPAERLRGLDDLEARRTETWRGWLSEPDARRHTLVAVAGNEVVGFVHGAPARDDDLDSDRVGELFAIYVMPDSWGAGAGRALMTAHLERLRASGFCEAVLWVLEDNPRARRFYEAAGWSTDGRTKEDEFLDTRVREVRYRIALG